MVHIYTNIIERFNVVCLLGIVVKSLCSLRYHLKGERFIMNVSLCGQRVCIGIQCIGEPTGALDVLAS